jgi:hypothetical protein
MATIFKRVSKGKCGGRYFISYFDHKGKRQTRTDRNIQPELAEILSRHIALKAHRASVCRDVPGGCGTCPAGLAAVCRT